MKQHVDSPEKVGASRTHRKRGGSQRGLVDARELDQKVGEIGRLADSGGVLVGQKVLAEASLSSQPPVGRLKPKRKLANPHEPPRPEVAAQEMRRFMRQSKDHLLSPIGAR